MFKNPLNYDANVVIFLTEAKKDAPDRKLMNQQLKIAVFKAAGQSALIGLAVVGTLAAGLAVAAHFTNTDGELTEAL